jgi:hypothetical protein
VFYVLSIQATRGWLLRARATGTASSPLEALPGFDGCGSCVRFMFQIRVLTVVVAFTLCFTVLLVQAGWWACPAGASNWSMVGLPAWLRAFVAGTHGLCSIHNVWCRVLCLFNCAVPPSHTLPHGLSWKVLLSTHTRTHTDTLHKFCGWFVRVLCLHAQSLKQLHGVCSTHKVWCGVLPLVCLCSSFARLMFHTLFTFDLCRRQLQHLAAGRPP